MDSLTVESSKLIQRYDCMFVFQDEDDDLPQVTQFIAYDPGSVKKLMSALCSYHSGDDVRAYINGYEAVLNQDWGLMDPKDMGV